MPEIECIDLWQLTGPLCDSMAFIVWATRYVQPRHQRPDLRVYAPLLPLSGGQGTEGS